MNKTTAKAKIENGSFNFNGKSFVLTEQAYLSGTSDNPHYASTAKLEVEYDDDNADTYEVRWDILDDFDYKTNDDETVACDWDNPVLVTKN